MPSPVRDWFKNDVDGMEEVVRRRGVATLPLELLANAWDTDADEVKLTIRPVAGHALVEIYCTDNDPKGFMDLTDSYTLYKRSTRRADPNKRGRFNIGEKEILCVCREATITSVTGTVKFNRDGTRTRGKTKRDVGTEFHGIMKMTREEFHETLQVLGRVIPPVGVKTFLNGHALGDFGDPIGTFEETLPTELEREDGSIGKTKRKAKVEIYEASGLSTPRLYEMGIPVCEIPDDKWNINVQQKVPLPRDRDSVAPTYLKKLRVAVVNSMHAELEGDDAAAAWVTDAIDSDEIEQEAFEHVFEERFGEDTVIADPSDPEANARAAAEGYTVVHGGSLGLGAWGNVKRYGASEAAGKVFPTAHPEFSLDGVDSRIDPSEYTPGMKAVVKYLKKISNALLRPEIHLKGEDVRITIVRDQHNRFRAWYGCSTYTLNLNVLGHKFFNQFPENIDAVNDLTIHELGHEFASNHLSEDYYRGLTKLGARLARLAWEHPRWFKIQ